jgi:hypothetical protein
LPLALADHGQQPATEVDIRQPQPADLAGTQAPQQHRQHQRPVAMGAQIGQERGDVLGVESLGKTPRFADQLPAPARTSRAEMAQHPSRLGTQPLPSSRSRHRVRLQRPSIS